LILLNMGHFAPPKRFNLIKKNNGHRKRKSDNNLGIRLFIWSSIDILFSRGSLRSRSLIYFPNIERIFWYIDREAVSKCFWTSLSLPSIKGEVKFCKSYIITICPEIIIADVAFIPMSSHIAYWADDHR